MESKSCKLVLAFAAACSAVLMLSVPVSAANSGSEQKIYRLYNPNSGEHFYTASFDEQKNLVSLGWYSDDAKEIPLYRQYNPNAEAGSHSYTTSKAEKDNLVKAGWRAEGISWYAVNPSADSSDSSESTAEATSELVYKTIHHNAIMHVEKSTVYSFRCSCCGQEFATGADRDAHDTWAITDASHASWNGGFDMIPHTTYTTVVDQEAYDEIICVNGC